MTRAARIKPSRASSSASWAIFAPPLVVAGAFFATFGVNTANAPTSETTPTEKSRANGQILIDAGSYAVLPVVGAVFRALLPAARAARTISAAERELGDELTDIAGRATRRRPAMVIGAENPTTGTSAAGRSYPGPTGCCAETNAADNVGGSYRDVRFTQPVRPATGQTWEVCKDCQKKFDRSQFPPGTKFEGDQ